MDRKVRWDPIKAGSNWKKHHVRFEEAATVFQDPLMVSIEDQRHSIHERRFLAVDESGDLRVLVVAYEVRDDEARIISAREGTRAERRRYMQGDEIHDSARVAEEDDVPAEVDFANGVRGRHHIPRTVAMVRIEEDVTLYFPDSDSVNAALRMLIAEGRFPPAV